MTGIRLEIPLNVTKQIVLRFVVRERIRLGLENLWDCQACVRKSVSTAGLDRVEWEVFMKDCSVRNIVLLSDGNVNIHRSESQEMPSDFVESVSNLLLSEGVPEEMNIEFEQLLSKPSDVLRYQPEDGGILDCWRDLYSEEWRYDHTLKNWQRFDEDRGWLASDTVTVKGKIQDLFSRMNQLARDGLQECVQEMVDGAKAQREMPQYKALIKATQRTSARINSVEGMARLS